MSAAATPANWLVTGANKGIGLAIVEGLLKAGAFVYLGSRDVPRGEAAVQQLIAADPSAAARLKVVQLDVESDASVQAAVQAIGSREGFFALDGLINNAGSATSMGYTNHAEAEFTLNLNLLGARRVTEAILPLMPQDARIVMIGSGGGPSSVSKCSEARQAFFRDADVTWEGISGLVAEFLSVSANATGTDDPKGAFAALGLGEGAPYGLSKALLHCYAVDLARKHPQKKINSCSPGFVETDLTMPFAAKMGKTAQEMGMVTPAQGAKTPLFLAMSDEVPTPQGIAWYFGSDSKRSPLHKYRSPGDPPYDGGDDFQSEKSFMAS